MYGDDLLLKCLRCKGFQWIGDISNIEDLYTSEYFNGDEYVSYDESVNIYRLNLERKWQTVINSCNFKNEKNVRNGCDERVFELGAATGEFLRVLKKEKITSIIGAEISSFCRDKAAKDGFEMLDPLSSNYMQQIHDFAPTVLCAWDVWEHLENPSAIFKEILAKNPSIEVVALSTVDSGAFVPRFKKTRWRQFHPPTHLNYPTRESFKIFFEEHGFSIKNISAFGYYRPLADYLSVFFGRERVTSFPLLFKIPIYLNLYDIQLIVAQKIK
jgi:hypothetical protein